MNIKEPLLGENESLIKSKSQVVALFLGASACFIAGNQMIKSGVLQSQQQDIFELARIVEGQPCASEGENCQCSGLVYYGKPKSDGLLNERAAYATQWADDSGSIGCSNAVFGDPVPGIVKACYCVEEAIPEITAIRFQEDGNIDGGNGNDLDYVWITNPDCDGDNFKWNNKAGEQWSLTPVMNGDQIDYFDVGTDCPYYQLPQDLDSWPVTQSYEQQFLTQDSECASNPGSLTSPFGQAYQWDRSRYGIGIESYHFVTDAEGPYMSLENHDVPQLPNRIYFQNPQFDRQQRKFTGTLDISMGGTTTWGSRNEINWYVQIVFSQDFKTFQSATNTKTFSNGQTEVQSYLWGGVGWSLCYSGQSWDAEVQNARQGYTQAQLSYDGERITAISGPWQEPYTAHTSFTTQFDFEPQTCEE